MHQNIVTVAQEMNKDRQQFHWLRGKISLWKVDPDDKTRMKMIDHQVGQARASARSAEQQQARDDKVQGESEDEKVVGGAAATGGAQRLSAAASPPALACLASCSR